MSLLSCVVVLKMLSPYNKSANMDKSLLITDIQSNTIEGMC
jgi:hypothetical protein